MKTLTTLIILLLLYGCNSPNQGKSIVNSTGDSESATEYKRVTDSTILKRNQTEDLDFEKKFYLKIDKIYTGKIYINKKGWDVFYRVLFIPEEENTMIEAENISIGEEGGNYKLIKRFRLKTNIDSLTFVDSVTIKTYIDGKKSLINLDTIN